MQRLIRRLACQHLEAPSPGVQERHRFARMPRIRPPFVALGLLLAAWGVDLLTGAERLVPWPWAGLGAGAVVLGLVLANTSIRLFRRSGTTHDPRETPTSLVVWGPYRYTRNPMYVGLAAILLGIALLVGSWPFFLVPLLFLLVMNFWYVPHEERALRDIFGVDYEAFRARVRRWL